MRLSEFQFLLYKLHFLVEKQNACQSGQSQNPGPPTPERQWGVTRPLIVMIIEISIKTVRDHILGSSFVPNTLQSPSWLASSDTVDYHIH